MRQPTTGNLAANGETVKELAMKVAEGTATDEEGKRLAELPWA